MFDTEAVLKLLWTSEALDISFWMFTEVTDSIVQTLYYRELLRWNYAKDKLSTRKMKH